MSDERLGERIHSLLADHLSSEGGGMVTSFHLVAEFIDSDGDESWLFATAPDQTQTRTVGLIEWARGVARYEQHRYLDDITDDD